MRRAGGPGLAAVYAGGRESGLAAVFAEGLRRELAAVFTEGENPVSAQDFDDARPRCRQGFCKMTALC